MKGQKAALRAMFGAATALICLFATTANGAPPGNLVPVAALSQAAGPQQVTAAGVGKVRLGRSFVQLRRQGLVGKMRRGCPLGGPGMRSAPLAAPLRGSVDLTTNRPRRARSITLTGGAAARGVGIGDRFRDIKAKFPRATLDRRTIPVFRIAIANVPRGGGGRIQFAVNADTGRITLIGVPFIPFCE